MTYTLDHIAVACADLDVGAAWLSGKLGLPLLDGGRHAHFGTHNKLLGLADGLYLEVIAPDPDANISVPRWFNLDHAPDVPAWGNWIAQAADLNAMASLTGPPVDMERGDLRWQLTVPDDGSLPMGGGFPTLIKWGADTAHPATVLPDSGCRLIRWEVFHPDADTLRALYGNHDPRVVFTPRADIGFTATFDTPNGPRTVA